VIDVQQTLINSLPPRLLLLLLLVTIVMMTMIQ